MFVVLFVLICDITNFIADIKFNLLCSNYGELFPLVHLITRLLNAHGKFIKLNDVNIKISWNELIES